MKPHYLAAAAAMAFASPATAQPAKPEPKIAQVIVFGNDPCPASSEDTIVVCAKKPEGERYRIPDELRGRSQDPESQSWATRATELQYVGRSGIGSCSTSGPGGMIGCYNDLVRQARAERAANSDASWSRMVEDARRERQEAIEREAAEEEAEANSPE